MSTYTKIVLLCLTSFGVGLASGYILGTSALLPHEPMHLERENIPLGMHRMSDGSLMPHSAHDHDGENSMEHMDSMMVTSERAFLEGMIPHHQEAVVTAREVIARGATAPEVTTLVQNIVTAQEAEIAAMKSWYETWYGEPYVDTERYEPMMRDLTNLSGTALDRAFLEDMIMHHMGAIMMARSVQPYIEHTEIANLTAAIVATQSEEIAMMREMLEFLK
jgi:uncharacterized protein (DUF305 family)